MDWKMPGMDGIETASRIKKDSRFFQGKKAPAIIMITGYEIEAVLQKTTPASIDALLHKPITISTMFDTIMEVFGKEVVKRPLVAESKIEDMENLKQIRGAKILLVEDNEINQQVARELLEKGGFVVTIANDGKEAIEAVKKNDYDAVLMDVQMPVMDGYEATAEIRKWECGMRNREKTPIRTPNSEFRIPIIAMTAHAMSKDREKCMEAGMNDYVSKPINPE
jgi:CheY-like chemotaxis protein